MQPRKDVIYPNQRQKGLFNLPVVKRSLQVHVCQNTTNGATDREITGEVKITHSPGVVFEQPLNDAFL